MLLISFGDPVAHVHELLGFCSLICSMLIKWGALVHVLLYFNQVLGLVIGVYLEHLRQLNGIRTRLSSGFIGFLLADDANECEGLTILEVPDFL